jgi:hypothetical protein
VPLQKTLAGDFLRPYLEVARKCASIPAERFFEIFRHSNRILSDGTHYPYITGLGAFGFVGDFELDHVTLFQGFEPLSLNGGVVNKNIFSAFRVYKPEAFLIVEPFDCAFCHDVLLE